MKDTHIHMKVVVVSTSICIRSTTDKVTDNVLIYMPEVQTKYIGIKSVFKY